MPVKVRNSIFTKYLPSCCGLNGYKSSPSQIHDLTLKSQTYKQNKKKINKQLTLLEDAVSVFIQHCPSKGTVLTGNNRIDVESHHRVIGRAASVVIRWSLGDISFAVQR